LDGCRKSSDHAIERTHPRLPLRSLDHPHLLLEIRTKNFRALLGNFANVAVEFDSSSNAD